VDVSAQPELVAREPTVRVLILNAGKATRLDGHDKLFVEAGGVPVHEWHRRAYDGLDVALVTRTGKATPDWITRVHRHDASDGPLGAVNSYLQAYDDDKELLVVYADTLIAKQDLPDGDWVGVSLLLQRRWDHVNRYGQWVNDILPQQVGVGVYRFADLDLLRRCIESLDIKLDHHLPDLLNLYAASRYLAPFTLVGWHDAGDWAALSRVPNIRSL